MFLTLYLCIYLKHNFINSTFNVVQSTCVHHAEFIGIPIKYIKHMKLMYSTALEY
jgi:hypothetical protein